MEVPGRVNRELEKSSSGFSSVCMPCQLDNRQEEAMGYCKVCMEYLCFSCIGCHQRFRLTRNHPILQESDISHDPKVTIDTGDAEPCEKHFDKLIEYVCHDHNIICCAKCIIAEHRSCKIDSISELAHSFKDSQEYKNLVSDIEESNEKLQESREQILEAGKATKSMLQSVVVEIQKFRLDAIAYLDNQEQSLLEKARLKEEEYQKKISNAEKRRVNFHEDVLRLKDVLETYEDQPFRLYIEARRAAAELSRCKSESDSLLSSVCMQQYTFMPTEQLKAMITDNKTIGSFEESKKQATLSESAADKEIGDDVFIALKGKISVAHKNDYSSTYISGVVQLNSEKLLVADMNNKALKLIDLSSEQITSVLRLSDGPWDVTRISGNEAAVTLPMGKKIRFVSTNEELRETREIPVHGFCRGICYADGNIIVTYREPAVVEILDLGVTVYKSHNLNQDGMALFQRSSFVEIGIIDKEPFIFAPDSIQKTMTKISMNLEIVSTFKDLKISRPAAIAAVRNNCLAICDHDGKCVKVFTEIGGVLSVVKQWECVDAPAKIALSPDKNTIYLSSLSNDNRSFLSVYEIKTK